jgi:hypothetical protein
MLAGIDPDMKTVKLRLAQMRTTGLLSDRVLLLCCISITTLSGRRTGRRTISPDIKFSPAHSQATSGANKNQNGLNSTNWAKFARFAICRLIAWRK